MDPCYHNYGLQELIKNPNTITFLLLACVNKYLSHWKEGGITVENLTLTDIL